MISLTVKEIARQVSGKIIGDENVIINSVAKIDEAKPGDLSFIYLPAYEKFQSTTKASALLVKPDLPKTRNDITYIEVESPEKAFFLILREFFSPEFPLTGIDKTASIHPDAKLGNNVALGKNVIISKGCRIGDNTKIFHNTVLYEDVEIGNDCLIFSNISIRESCKIGNRVIIHSGTVIGSDGFGFNPDEKGVYQKIPQIGNVIIEDDVELGANVAIDRAALGSTIIKRGTKIDNLVQIAHNVVIGEDTVISSQTGISGSTKIGNHVIIAGQVGIVGHIEIGDNVVLMAQSGISKSIKKPGYYFGYPAKELRTSQKLEAHIRNLPDYADKIKKLEEEIKKLKSRLTSNP
ncbi:MAG: UDP-3-O-(3-hydroxymyristoyl)glucosamine N-acyltransferase [Ignavibacterium sp.]|jgi:UDP-3-O-[3-hydroxymyristoyl] glucosamine N-acyltransferase|uniref:UDP-3-O-(3-hydroxymyristoyl)glucosamine N-acyltransferase n=1 Tax=Ignavibacterium sp. TaxID=2651167 RepID=UPI00329911F7